MKHYDVVVAGAGPSGATAAYYLAKQGKSVAFVDRAKFPREKACGGGLCVHIEEFDHIINNWDDFLESKCGNLFALTILETNSSTAASFFS